ncbi:MAG: hypothetical protein WC889_18455 [Myxococcota bacterium]|jgi:hypothetical protein
MKRNTNQALVREDSSSTGRVASPLPVYDLGKPSVDISDRDELLDVLDGKQAKKRSAAPHPLT